MASVPDPHRDTPADQLLDPARQMSWRVPELALLLSDRAVALARSEGDRPGRLRAEALALFALNRLGRGVAAAGRAIAAVREAEAAADDCAPELRVELAWCARSAGSHDVASRVLRPVLEQKRLDPVLRAHALVAFAAVNPAASARGKCAEALDEAERLYSACELNRDAVRLLRARGRAARAAHHRRFAEFPETVQAAADGLDLLRQLGDPVAESGEVHARLVLEQVQALIELGRAREVAALADLVLNRPVRAAAAEPIGWLGLAVATRRHLPEGDRGAAIRLLNDTAAVAERHRLDGLLAETLNVLSHALEQGSEHEPALHALRGAYAADRRHRSAVHEARLRLLEEFPAVGDDAPAHSPGAPAARQVIPPQPAAPDDAGSTAPRGAEVHDRAAEPNAEHAQPPLATVPHPDDPSGPDPSGTVAGGPEPSEPEPNRAAPSGVPAAEVSNSGSTSGSRAVATENSGVAGLPGLPDEHALRATDNVRDAARRLMETLTSRAEQDSARNPQAVPQPRAPHSPEGAQPPPAGPNPGQHHAPGLGDALPDDGALPDYDGWEFHFEPGNGNHADTAPPVSADLPDLERREPAGAQSDDRGAGPALPDPSGDPALDGSADQNSLGVRNALDERTAVDPHPEFDSTAVLPAVGTSPPGSAPRSADEPTEPDPSDEPELLDTEHDASVAHEHPPDVREPAQRAAGRRSSGRSLAEIQAALQALEPSGSGRRRARHTEPRTADPDPTPAAEMLAKHHDDWNRSAVDEHSPASAEPSAGEQLLDAPGPDRTAQEPFGDPHVLSHPIPGGIPTDPDRAADEGTDHLLSAGQYQADAEDRPRPDDRSPGHDPTGHDPADQGTTDQGTVEERTGADRAADQAGAAPAERVGEPDQVGLADLLTEALMAYESGRRSEPAARPDAPGRHETPAQQDLEPDPAPVGRHSRPAAGAPGTTGTGSSAAIGRTASRSRHGAAAEPSGRSAGSRHRHASLDADPPAETSG